MPCPFKGTGDLKRMNLMAAIVAVALAALFADPRLAATAPGAPGLQGQGVSQSQKPAASAGAMAVELSRLEAASDFEALYDLMHPGAKAVVPLEAVVGWYEAFFANQRTEPLTVTGVAFITWTWGVTGETYLNTAQVSFDQPYIENGVRTVQAGTVHLVETDAGWAWFFGASRAFVDEQIGRYLPGAYASFFPNPLDADVNGFWFRTMTANGGEYLPPAGVVGLDAPTLTGCGLADPAEAPAFYCTLDQTIYYDTGFRALVEERAGDFAWVSVVAHEWGHHIQTELGLFNSGPMRANDGTYAVTFELQADCLAGAYTQDAEARGWLDPGDIDEAILLTTAAGDPTGTTVDNPNAHGTSAQRVDAFLTGYQEGLTGCDLDLAA